MRNNPWHPAFPATPAFLNCKGTLVHEGNPPGRLPALDGPENGNRFGPVRSMNTGADLATAGPSTALAALRSGRDDNFSFSKLSVIQDSLTSISRRSFAEGIGTSLDQGQAQSKRCALSFNGFEVNRTVVPLQNLVGLCQTNAGPTFFGGEIQLENLVLNFKRNAAALVANLCHHHFVFAPRRNPELASV